MSRLQRMVAVVANETDVVDEAIAARAGVGWELVAADVEDHGPFADKAFLVFQWPSRRRAPGGVFPVVTTA